MTATQSQIVPQLPALRVTTVDDVVVVVVVVVCGASGSIYNVQTSSSSDTAFKEDRVVKISTIPPHPPIF